MTNSNYTMEFKGIAISYDQDQTIGNCIDLGFGTEKIKSIILDMQKDNVDYLNKRQLEKLR